MTFEHFTITLKLYELAVLATKVQTFRGKYTCNPEDIFRCVKCIDIISKMYLSVLPIVFSVCMSSYGQNFPYIRVVVYHGTIF